MYREFEETMDALQADIDALEVEKAELKERLRVLSKKQLLEGLVSSQRSPGSSGGAVGAAGGAFAVKDSPMLLQQVGWLLGVLVYRKLGF